MNVDHPADGYLERWIRGSRLLLTLRNWTDRDGRHWKVRLETGPPAVLVFASKGDVWSVLVDFTDGLDDRSDADLGRRLDEGRGGLSDVHSLGFDSGHRRGLTDRGGSLGDRCG